MLEKFLQDIGLSSKEVKIYLILLSVDTYSVIELSQKTNINRTSVYPILEELIKKGLVSEVKIGKKINYQAEPPERIETFIEQQKIKLNEQSKVIQDILPQIKGLSRQSGERPVVKYYEGREGIIKSVSDYLETGTKGGMAYLIYPKDLIEELFEKTEIQKAKKYRLKKGVKITSIYTYSKGKLPTEEMSNRFRVDEKKYPIKCDIGIYEDRVRINTLGKNLSAIFIKSSDVAETLRTLFKLALETLNKDDKK